MIISSFTETDLICKQIYPFHLGNRVSLFDTNKSYRELIWQDKYQLQINRQIRNLKAFVRVRSITPVSIPSPGEFTDDFQYKMKINSILWQSDRKHLDLFFSKGGQWIQRGTASLVNREDTPYYDLDLMGYFTESDVIDLGEDNKISVAITDTGNGFLREEDSIQIYGTIIKTVTLMEV